MFTFAKLKLAKSPDTRTPSWFKVLAAGLFVAVLALPMAANAQVPAPTACVAGEAAATFSFATPNDWVAGSSSLNVNLGAGASAVTMNGVATMNDVVALNPTTAPSGNFADSYYYLVDRTIATASNTVTFTFSKPVRGLKLVVTDIDYFDNGGGNIYQDRVNLSGAGPSGVVVPTAVATSGRVNVVGAQATSTGTANCSATDDRCNATYTFAQAVTSISMVYDNGAAASGDPVNQVVGLAAFSFCVQNPDLSLVKNDAGASFTAGSTGTYSFTVNNTGLAATVTTPATTGGPIPTTTVKDILPAGMSFGTPLTPGGANAVAWTCVRSTTTNTDDTATCTTTTAIAAAGSSTFTLPVSVASTVASGTTLTNRAKVFGGGDPNKTAETTTGAITACASDSLAGAVANAGCGFETTPITAAASVVITKTDGKAVTSVGGANNYLVTLTNQGPSSANNVIVTDVVGAGMTCPGTNVVTCSGEVNGAVCPTGLTIASLISGVAVATLPPTGSLQFAYVCNVN